jgi:hypothetical protein
MVLHEELCHHDYEGVLCQECDEFIDEENEEEEPDQDRMTAEDTEWLKKVEETNNRPNRGKGSTYSRLLPELQTFDQTWEPNQREKTDGRK